jgi:hypothetical protein
MLPWRRRLEDGVMLRMVTCDSRTPGMLAAMLIINKDPAAGSEAKLLAFCMLKIIPPWITKTVMYWGGAVGMSEQHVSLSMSGRQGAPTHSRDDAFSFFSYPVGQ